jgi:hypothetical protein
MKKKNAIYFFLLSSSLLMAQSTVSTADEEILKDLDFYMNLDLIEKMEIVEPDSLSAPFHDTSGDPS